MFLNTQYYQYLCLKVWFHTKKSKGTLKKTKSLILQCKFGSWAQKWPKIAKKTDHSIAICSIFFIGMCKFIYIGPRFFHMYFFEIWLSLVAEKLPLRAKFTYSNFLMCIHLPMLLLHYIEESYYQAAGIRVWRKIAFPPVRVISQKNSGTNVLYI